MKILFTTLLLTTACFISCSKQRHTLDSEITDVGKVEFTDGKSQIYKLGNQNFAILIPSVLPDNHILVSVVFQNTNILDSTKLPGALKVETTKGQTIKVSDGKSSIRFTPTLATAEQDAAANP